MRCRLGSIPINLMGGTWDDDTDDGGIVDEIAALVLPVDESPVVEMSIDRGWADLLRNCILDFAIGNDVGRLFSLVFITRCNFPMNFHTFGHRSNTDGKPGID